MKTKNALPYSGHEKDLFKKLVLSKWDTISQTEKDFNTRQMRAVAWQDITDQFNAASEVKRNAKQMKKLWQNLKTEKKKIVTECLPLKLPQDSPKSTKQSNCKSFVSLDPSCIPFIDGDTACSEDSEGASGSHFLASNTTNALTSKPDKNVTVANKQEPISSKQEPISSPVSSLHLPASGMMYQIILPNTSNTSNNTYRPILPKPANMLDPRKKCKNKAKQKRFLFSNRDKMKLRELVAEYQEIVNSKKCDGGTVINKKRAWESIAISFNKTGPSCKRTSLQLRKLWGNLKFKGKRKDASQPPEPNANDIEDQSINGGLDTEEPIVEELASLKAEPTCEIMTEQDDVDEPFRMSELQDADEISMHENSTVLGLNDLGEDEMTSPELSLHSDEKQTDMSDSSSSSSEESEEDYRVYMEEVLAKPPTESSQVICNTLESNNRDPSQQSNSGTEPTDLRIQYLRELYELKKKKNDLVLKMLQTRMTHKANKFELEKQILEMERKIWMTRAEHSPQEMSARLRNSNENIDVKSKLLKTKLKRSDLKMRSLRLLEKTHLKLS